MVQTYSDSLEEVLATPQLDETSLVEGRSQKGPERLHSL